MLNLHDTYQRNADGALNKGKPCRAMGIDIGTTTVSVVLLDGMSGELLGKSTVVHGADLPGDLPEAHLQDPDKLTTAALQAAEALMEQCGASDCIGLTGQMHGMLYVNGEGQAVSPLYTWRDGRGVLPGNGGSCAEQLRRTGGEASAGFGLTTHFWLQKQGGIPQNAAGMVTISDYLGMRLCGRTVPIIARDMAASWGSFDLRQGDFCREALERCGVDTAYLPEVAWEHGVMGYVAGGCGKGAPVVVSLGDNQASVFGSVRDLCSTVLLNIGTGSQISVGTTGHHDCGGSIELRPCVGGTSLLVGSGLCGGSAYATLERFYREIAGTETPMYGMMEQQARQFLYEYGMEAAWKVRTTFAGTRSDPDARGMVGGISTGNFRPGALTLGVLQGILEELHGMYRQMCEMTGTEAIRLVGSGNGIRKNALLRELAEERFGMALEVPIWEEEAACGAALHALAACGLQNSIEAAQQLIRYGSAK